jgi:hypothetical protein
MKRPSLVPIACAAGIFFFLGGCTAQPRSTVASGDIATEAARQQRTLAPMTLNVLVERMDVCASSPIPNGWIKVDDHWNPTTCGNPSSIVYNVVTIERYDNKPAGAVMTVCAGAATPNGWVEIGSSWNPTMCGHPSSIVNNVKQIKRVN